MRLDHVIYGTSDLDKASARIEAELGLPVLREPFLPFFIGSNARGPRPGDAGDAGGLTWIEVAGDQGRLSDWLGGADLPIRVVEGASAVRAIGIGDREFRP
jgi:catechol 2,3-dioxygenase-like lactoylglutathione lyase family enzyme